MRQFPGTSTINNQHSQSGQRERVLLFGGLLVYPTGFILPSRRLNQVAVEDKSNEIPALKTLLDPLQIDGVLITADALHTQRQSARYIVQEKGGHYLLTLKDNQPGLLKRIEEALSGRTFSLGPS